MIRSGKICASLIYNYLAASFTKEEGEEDNDDVDSEDGGNGKYQKDLHKIKVLGETFASYGGVLSKISQMVNYSYGVYDTNVYSNCVLINPEKTKKILESEMLEFDDEILSYDIEVFKSGSVGQVHKAVYKDGTDIVIKVQYHGIDELFDSDLKIVEMIGKFLFYSSITNAIDEVKKQIKLELDFRNEAKNQIFMGKCWESDPYIKIPRVIESIVGDKIIAMEFIKDGQSLVDFIKSSTQDEIDFFGNQLIRFMFTNLFRHNLIYTDVHYGNFIIQNKTQMVVLDFGNVYYLDEQQQDQLKMLLRSIYIKDKELFYNTMTEMGIISPTVPISDESKEYMWEYFNLNMRPWVSDDVFHFSEKFLDECSSKKVNLLKEWLLPSNIVWLNKLVHGFAHILGTVQVKGCWIPLFKELVVYN
jgi:predicted unusual protein kinase regulating ubiquinone biosynthesis (AarF/ABC1/UbiB family)